MGGWVKNKSNSSLSNFRKLNELAIVLQERTNNCSIWVHTWKCACGAHLLSWLRIDSHFQQSAPGLLGTGRLSQAISDVKVQIFGANQFEWHWPKLEIIPNVLNVNSPLARKLWLPERLHLSAFHYRTVSVTTGPALSITIMLVHFAAAFWHVGLRKLQWASWQWFSILLRDSLTAHMNAPAVPGVRPVIFCQREMFLSIGSINCKQANDFKCKPKLP